MPDLDALFEQALDLGPDARPAFFDRACVRADGSPDPDLRARLERLVAAADEPDPFFDRPEDLLGGTKLGALAASVMRPAGRGEEQLGARVGPYAVEALVGEGGMGAVYRARRADGAFEQDVALKVVRPGLGLASPATEARFEQERQVLAALDHPHIARLLGGGRTDPDGPFGGVPYLAMEYVDGVPITAYADESRLSLEGRIALIQQACAAVQHAHGRLVVHRDLKPSNVLVAEDDDGRPRVKVLDFGIAKLLGGDGEAASGLTQTHVRLLTPAYAAPEQFRAVAVATTADVYALGVLLYELLTGRWPYAEGATGRRSATEIERVVLAGQPVRASAAALREEDRATRAFARGESAPRLAKRLQGDLDLICAKALHADPARRYASAAALADDLGRYLDGLPVTARPDSAAYRVRKFVGRHRAGVAAAALGLVALVGALGVALWQADRAQDALAAEQAARAAAEAETERANAMTAFTTGMISSMDPALVGDSLISVRTMLSAGRASAEDLADQPDLYASALYTLGSLYGTLDDFDTSLELLAAGEAALEADASPIVRALLATRRSTTLSRMGRYDEAQRYAEQALDLVEREPLVDPHGVYLAASALAQAHENAGRYAASEDLWRRSVEGLQRIEKQEFKHRKTLVIALHGLASALDEQGRDREATAYYERVIALTESSDDLPPIASAASKGNLGHLLSKAERYEEALALYQRAVADTERTYGPDHIQTLAVEINLARGLAYQGRYEDADRRSQVVLDAMVGMFGAESPYVGFVLGKRGDILMEMGRIGEAEEAARRAMAVVEGALGPEHPQVVSAGAQLGQVYLCSGRPAEAEPLLRAAYEMERATGGAGSTNTALSAATLAKALAAMGELPEARALYRSALPALEEQHPGAPVVGRVRGEWEALYPEGSIPSATGRDEA